MALGPARLFAGREGEVQAEFGMDVPADVAIRVVDSTAELRYLVLPMRPDGTDEWPPGRLAELVTRNSMIGTGYPRRPG